MGGHANDKQLVTENLRLGIEITKHQTTQFPASVGNCVVVYLYMHTFVYNW